MSSTFPQTGEQFNKARPSLPNKTHGVSGVDDQRALFEIIFRLQRC